MYRLFLFSWFPYVLIPCVQMPEGDYLLLPAVNDPFLISDGQFASGAPPGSRMALDPGA